MTQKEEIYQRITESEERVIEHKSRVRWLAAKLRFRHIQIKWLNLLKQSQRMLYVEIDFRNTSFLRVLFDLPIGKE